MCAETFSTSQILQLNKCIIITVLESRIDDVKRLD